MSESIGWGNNFRITSPTCRNGATARILKLAVRSTDQSTFTVWTYDEGDGALSTSAYSKFSSATDFFGLAVPSDCFESPSGVIGTSTREAIEVQVTNKNAMNAAPIRYHVAFDCVGGTASTTGSSSTVSSSTVIVSSTSTGSSTTYSSSTGTGSSSTGSWSSQVVSSSTGSSSSQVVSSSTGSSSTGSSSTGSSSTGGSALVDKGGSSGGSSFATTTTSTGTTSSGSSWSSTTSTGTTSSSSSRTSAGSYTGVETAIFGTAVLLHVLWGFTK